MKLTLTALLFLLALSSGAAQPAAPLAQTKTTIEGVLREEKTGRPIGGANVYLFGSARFVPSPTDIPAVTDAQGRFTHSISAPGLYRLLPEQPGFVYSRPPRLKNPRPGTPVRITESTRTLNVELAMAREGSIVGQILDIAGKPIPSVTVYAGGVTRDSLGNVGTSNIGTTQPQHKTNDRGEFRLYGLQAGDYYLGVTMAAQLFGTPGSYYPGESDVARAAVIHVNEGEETRTAPMTMESPARAVSVRLRFVDPAVAALPIGGEVLGTGYGFGSGGGRGFGPPPVSREIPLTLFRGRYDLLLYAWSPENDLFYAREKFEVGTQEMTREIRMTPGIRITGSMKFEDADGKLLDVAKIQCRLQSAAPSALSAPGGCLRAQVSPGMYQLEMSGMPADAYVVSAKSGDRDILRDGLPVEKETQLDIRLATPGAIIAGIVLSDKGERLSEATVVLVPDAPYRNATVLYRTDVSAYDGTFELRGAAPGSYRLFAWSDLQGTAYRNAEFLKLYEAKGKPLTIDKASRLSADLTALE